MRRYRPRHRDRTAARYPLFRAAAADQRVLVTYDCRTIPPLLKEWAETGQHHAGVVLIDEKTIRPPASAGWFVRYASSSPEAATRTRRDR